MTALERGRRLRLETRNNPTGRLLDIVTAMNGIQDHISARDAWAQVFACPRDDTGALLRGLAQLIKLLTEAREATVAHAEGNSGLFLAPFDLIESMLAKINFDQSWSNVRAHISDRMLNSLEFGDNMLSGKYGMSSMNEAKIEELLTSLSSLSSECLESKLPDELKKFFVQAIESLRSALLGYRIIGPEGIQDEIDRISATLYRRKASVRDAGENSETGSLVERFFKVLGDINASVQFTQNALMLGPPLFMAIKQIPM